MDAVFSLQVAVGVIALDFDGGGLDAGFFALQQGGDRHLVAVALAPAEVHAHEHGRPVVRLRAAGAGIDGKDCAEVVAFVPQHILEFQRLHGLDGLGEGGIQFAGFIGFDGFVLAAADTVLREVVQDVQVVHEGSGLLEVRHPGLHAGELLEEAFGGLGVVPEIGGQAFLRLLLHFLPFAGDVQALFEGVQAFAQVLDLFEGRHDAFRIIVQKYE